MPFVGMKPYGKCQSKSHFVKTAMIPLQNQGEQSWIFV